MQANPLSKLEQNTRLKLLHEKKQVSSEMPQLKVAIVDDNITACEELMSLLNYNGYAASAFGSSRKFLSSLGTRNYDLSIVDWMMPNLDGLQLIGYVSRHRPDIRTIMVSGKGRPEDIIAGLDAGADDYIVKPMNPDIMLSRVRAVIRRYHAGSNSEDFMSLGPFILRTSTSTVFVNGKAIVLPQQQFRVLKLLFENANRPVSRQMIASRMDLSTLAGHRAPDMLVARLRKSVNFEQWGGVSLETLYGRGYCLRVEAWILQLNAGGN